MPAALRWRAWRWYHSWINGRGSGRSTLEAVVSELIETDVLILGCGIAGATTALCLADQGTRVVVVSRGTEAADTNTAWAQGGIIYRAADDTPEALAEDILRAGAGHSYPPAVQVLATEGPGALERVLMQRVHVAFDHDAAGGLSLVREGGHGKARILHVADQTGRAIEAALVTALAAHPYVTLLTGHTAVDLLTPSHHSRDRLAVYRQRSCVGAYLFDQLTGQIRRCLARDTVLATGGLGQIYLRTTNPTGARGDGVAMAQRAGARVINLEFVQFHPTTFHHETAPNLLISEAVRGAGARLVRADGTPFMQDYAPEWKDLAPRDVVARAIHHEMLERGVTHVFLDLRSFIGYERILDEFPTIRATLLPYGVDIARDLVPVVPAAHYSCGGVWADEWGRTNTEHLYAVGEVACTGVHGANRLASTSLLEGVVWGERAAHRIAAELPSAPIIPADDIPPWREDGVEPPDPALISQDMSAIKHIMWNYVGLVRTTRRLNRAIEELRHLETEIDDFYRTSRVTDGLLGLRNAVRTGSLVALAAWQNKRSMGAHYRE
jgi:L-aspartate oxidase